MCFLTLLAIAACAPASAPDEDEDMAGWEDEGFPEDSFTPDFSDTHNEALVAAFTPEGATVHSDVESMLVLTTDKSMADMIAFCMAAVENMGIVMSDIDDTSSGFWVFNGSFGNLSIHIELRDDGDSVNLMLLY